MNYKAEEFTEKIQRFLSGNMTDEERTKFEDLIEKDESLQDEVKFQRGLTQFMHDEGAAKIQERVQRIKNTQENQSSFPWKKAVAAILILGILAVPVYYFFSNGTPEATYLSEKYFEVYPNRITQMGTGTNSLDKAMSYYDTKNYKKAAPLFEAVSNDSSGYAKLYLSICQIQNNQPSKAVVTLKSEIRNSSNDSNLKPVFQWYLIIALLKAEELDQAKIELKEYFKKGYRHNLDKANALSEELFVKR